MIARHKIAHLQQELKGLPVSRAWRSMGSMVHFELGRLNHYGDRFGPTRRRGDYRLMVEYSKWRLCHSRSDLATNGSATAVIDRAIKTVVGARILRICFNEQITTIAFSKQLSLALWPDETFFPTMTQVIRVFGLSTGGLTLHSRCYAMASLKQVDTGL